MADPWLSIIGIGEDGLPGLSDAARGSLAQAEIVFGGPRHLALAAVGDRGRPWPVPFSTAPVLALRGRRVAVLASGDPFWFGAGGSLSADLEPGEWRCHPAPSTFALAAARLGWRLEATVCLGLHAMPFEHLVPHLSQGARILCLLRDGKAPKALAEWLVARGFGETDLHVMEALGGSQERVRRVLAEGFALDDVQAPVAVALEVRGRTGLSLAPGRPEAAFAHDGQITKAPVRALTIAALAPMPAEVLWDIGGGSGSVSVEWCRLARGARSFAIEAKPARAENIRANAAAFGLEDRLTVVEGAAPEALRDLPKPDAVFIGGGGDEALLHALWPLLPEGCRLVANAVTLETEALYTRWSSVKGGDLTRIEIANATPLGRMRGWSAARPVVQWSVVA